MDTLRGHGLSCVGSVNLSKQFDLHKSCTDRARCDGDRFRIGDSVVDQQTHSAESLDRCREQLQQVQGRATEIGVLLRKLSRGLVEHGTTPSTDALDQLSQFRIAFEQLHNSISPSATGRLPDGVETDSEASLSELQEELDSRAVIQATLERLERVSTIRHLEQPEFGPWQRCLTDGIQLRNQLLAATSPQARSQAEQFLATQTPLNAIVTLVAEGSQLSDERWSTLLDAVSAEYGREVSTAIARGKLVMTSGTQA